jgi:hypothetical protein
VVGSGSKRAVGNEKMVYAMKITEKLSFGCSVIGLKEMCRAGN